MWVTGARAPEKASVTMLTGRIVCGCSIFVDLTTCPSAPQSRIVGVRNNVATFAVMTMSGGSGFGLHLGGDLTLTENPDVPPG